MSRRPLGTPLSFPLAPRDSGTETRAIWVGRYQLSRAECFFCFPLFFLSFFSSWFCFVLETRSHCISLAILELFI